MKSLVVLAMLLTSTQAFATSLAPLTCSNGNTKKSIEVWMLAGTVKINQYEWSVTVDNTKTQSSGNTTAILDQTVPGASEGVKFNATVNSLLVFNPNTMTLNTTIIVDGETVVAGEILKCK